MKIVRATPNRAPILMIYGAEGRGKTTLACKFPNALALLLERGLPRGVAVDAVESSFSLDDVMATLRDFYSDTHGYQSLIIDTADAFEAVLLEGLCRKERLEKHRTTVIWQGLGRRRYGMAPVLACP